MSRLVASIIIALLLPGWTATVLAEDRAIHTDVGAVTTYCNPLPIPNYPVGKVCRDVVRGSPANGGLWLQDRCEQFRELADPTALWHDGRWYLYPSVDMAWVSGDGGATWQHHPLNIRDVGYAPTVVRHRGRFLLLASGSDIYSSDSPLGPFTSIGKIELPPGLPGQVDPMLFSDDDGRLYYYWGCSEASGIFAVELDAANPTRVIGKPAHVISFEPDVRPWQRIGDWNEDPNKGWIEGAWMLKRDGRYYLTYSAAGTENRTYAMGCAVGKSPLGPFAAQKHDPILRSTGGLITGTGHGCIAEGPGRSLWAFYTIRAANVHGFERRIGMDPAFIDTAGELHVDGPSSVPRHLVNAGQSAESSGWLPLNVGVLTTGSSTAPNLSGRLAVDEDIRTGWQPAADDKAPVLTSHLRSQAMLHAIRIIWRDVGMDTVSGVRPGPFRYRMEAETSSNTWTTVVDRSASSEDFLIDYREFPPVNATAFRLVILGSPPGITPCVAEFTVFGSVARNASR